MLLLQVGVVVRGSPLYLPPVPAPYPSVHQSPCRPGHQPPHGCTTQTHSPQTPAYRMALHSKSDALPTDNESDSSQTSKSKLLCR